MSNRFAVPGDSSPPSTPDRSSNRGSGRSRYDNDPSTTPAGPPPSSAASFTPAGAPSASYMGSSMMRGVTTSKPVNFAQHKTGSSSKNLFAPKSSNTPLGRSIGGSSKAHPPSRLSNQVAVDDDDEEELSPPKARPGTFGLEDEDSYDDTYGEDEDEDADADAEAEADDIMDQDLGDDMWLAMHKVQSVGAAGLGDDSDLLMLATPAANERIRKEAEDIFRASSMQASSRRREYKYATLAKDMYGQAEFARITEPPELILSTELLVNKLYDDGIGEAEDEQILDDVLAGVASGVVDVWKAQVDQLPSPEEEHAAEIGPGPHALPLEKATYLANLALQIRHTRYNSDDATRAEPLPETVFQWLQESHNPYPSQVADVQRHRPSPACHSVFWQTVFVALLRGQVRNAQGLLRNAGWEHVRRGHRGEYSYVGKALDNVQRAVQQTCDLLDSCPGIDENWEIWSSDWTLFRIRARGALEQLRRFAEGKDIALSESGFADSSSRSRHSMSGMARKAESLVPWEIYENLNIIFEIVLGTQTAILGAAQDWCEATVGLFGWWDEAKSQKNLRVSHSQSLVLASQATDSESYLDRLARAFHTTMESDFQLNTLSEIEVGLACIFEDNAKGLIGLLRTWSLPVASAVAEIASLGRWLPPQQASLGFGAEELDMEDLELLNIDSRGPDEVNGIKDNTLVHYAQELANVHELSTVADSAGVTRDGWELAIYVLGRMDSATKSEEMVGNIVETLLEGLTAESSATVEKVWRLLNDLGMISLAELAAQTFGDVLARESHRYGEAMWYYALAHRPSKVREVMNLLISYSLLQSVAYPSTSELDEHLYKLIYDRNDTLKALARQDLEAAEVLGKMLSGYASLRQFYEIRDGDDAAGQPASSMLARKQQAAVALLSVIAASDDNIRGGLYDGSRDAIVSEDFLLALLGEATVFVTEAGAAAPNLGLRSGASGSASAITLDHIDTLLKAIEDLETVGPRVYDAADEFFHLVLASLPGLQGSNPSDLLKKSTSGGLGGSFVLGGSSLLASQLHRSITGSAALGGGKSAATKRQWDWRTKMSANIKGKDVLKRLRLGLTRDLARLWLEEADEAVW